MTTTIAATAHLFDDFTLYEVPVLVAGAGEVQTANTYVNDLDAIEGHHPWTWQCGADIAQWGALARGEWTAEHIALIICKTETAAMPKGVIRNDFALANRFDY